MIFVNDNTCLMSELPFSLGPSYLFVCKEIKIDKQVSSKTKVESCVIVKSDAFEKKVNDWLSRVSKPVHVKYCALSSFICLQ